MYRDCVFLVKRLFLFFFSCHLSTRWHEVLPTVCLLCERCTELFRRSSLANVQVVVMIINIIVNIIVNIMVKILIIIIGYGWGWWPSCNLHPLAQEASARSIIFAVSNVCIDWWKHHEQAFPTQFRGRSLIIHIKRQFSETVRSSMSDGILWARSVFPHASVLLIPRNRQQPSLCRLCQNKRSLVEWIATLYLQLHAVLIWFCSDDHIAHLHPYWWLSNHIVFYHQQQWFPPIC